MSGIGNPHQIQSLSNCFVIESPYDSYGGILKTDQELVQIAKRRGGVGFDISSIRPKGESTGNCARTTDGIEVFMDRFSNSCREVAQGGRRGALMLTISVHHPQVSDFIKIKRDLTRVTGANISVRVTDEFMNCLFNSLPFDLRFEGKVYKTVDPSVLWDKIMRATWDWAEPGVLFIDRINEMNNLYYCETIEATNPCGEQPLPPAGACLLGSFNLVKYVKGRKDEGNFFDAYQLSEAVSYTHLTLPTNREV